MDKKISELEALATSANDAVIPIVTSEATTTNKQTKQNFLKEITASLAEKADTSALTDHISDTANPHTVTKEQVGLSDVDNVQQIPMSEKGSANGVAELDSSGKVLASQLPSYVDDVVEVANFAELPTTGETGKIYITQDTNLTYRWSGTAYVEISTSIALGETSATAYRGDRGKIAYDTALTAIQNLGDLGITITANQINSSVIKETIITSSATLTPTGDGKRNALYVTAQAANATIAAPTGTPENGNTLLIRITSTGTYTLAFNAIFEAVGVTLPTGMTSGKEIYLGAFYNSTATKWQITAVVVKA